MKLFFLTILGLHLFFSCHNKASKGSTTSDELAMGTVSATEVVEEFPDALISALSDTSFLFLATLSGDFVYDMKYATTDNFLKTRVYSCDQCLIRKEVAEGLIKANNLLMQRGYRIKLFDCYRPLSIQKKMWEVLPDSKYVANPKYGSVHNRGGAVDITMVDRNGDELAMGTSFDHFGVEAHHSYNKLPDTVIANRRLLKESMEAAGFTAIDTEWWHYNYGTSGNYPVSDFETKCD